MEHNKFEMTGKVVGEGGQVKIYDKSGSVLYVSKVSICKKKDKEGNFEYFDFTFFGEDAAKKVGKVAKGDTINVTGRIRTNQYTSKSGDKVTTLELIGDEITKAIYDENKKQYVAVGTTNEGLSF